LTNNSALVTSAEGGQSYCEESR